MWSVWPEPVDLYLGRTVAMFGGEGRGSKAVVLRHPATMPHADLLANLSESLAEQEPRQTTSRRSLRISLSGALCPAIAFQAPQGIRQWSELQEVANAAAAASMGMEARMLRCETDSVRSGLLAAIPEVLHQQLAQWAGQQGWRIVSIQPLWAMATQCKAASAHEVQCVLLHEVDGLTLIAPAASSSQGKPSKTEAAALCMAGEHDAADPPAAARRWLIGHGLAQDKLLSLAFGPRARTAMTKGPQCWPMHWSRL